MLEVKIDKNLLNDRKKLTSNTLQDVTETSFLLPGTPVNSFLSFDNKVNIKEYFISAVRFDIENKYPVYTLRRHDVDEYDRLLSYKYDYVQEKYINVDSKIKKGEVLIKENLDVLENDVFFWLGTYVITSVEFQNAMTITHIVTTIFVDQDLNVTYGLDHKVDTVYSKDELITVVDGFKTAEFYI